MHCTQSTLGKIIFAAFWMNSKNWLNLRAVAATLARQKGECEVAPSATCIYAYAELLIRGFVFLLLNFEQFWLQNKHFYGKYHSIQGPKNWPCHCCFGWLWNLCFCMVLPKTCYNNHKKWNWIALFIVMEPIKILNENAKTLETAGQNQLF